MRRQVGQLIEQLDGLRKAEGLVPKDVIEQIQVRMTASAGHIREINDARNALAEAVELYKKVQNDGLKAAGAGQIAASIYTRHISLASVAYLKAIVTLLELGSGSRGSHLVLCEDGIGIHPSVKDRQGRPIRFKPENKKLRKTILRVMFDAGRSDLFDVEVVPLCPVPKESRSFELAWADFREGKVYTEDAL